MRRRDFLKGSATAVAVAALPALPAADCAPAISRLLAGEPIIKWRASPISPTTTMTEILARYEARNARLVVVF